MKPSKKDIIKEYFDRGLILFNIFSIAAIGAAILLAKSYKYLLNIQLTLSYLMVAGLTIVYVALTIYAFISLVIDPLLSIRRELEGENGGEN